MALSSFIIEQPTCYLFMQKVGYQIYLYFSCINFLKTKETMQQLSGKGTLELRSNCSLVLLKLNCCEV